MPLTDIYVLPSDYPLFDWSDWPASRAALVSGGETANFQKEAWNDIVAQLSAALTAGGLGWSGEYTTEADAKITERYGALTADIFNSVRHNIDWPAPLGWAWAKDPTFRGYTGRVDFRGVSRFGTACDSVYPEYILELVRKLNLLIGIMTGNKALPTSSSSGAETLASTLIEAIPTLGKSLLIIGSDISHGISAPAGIDAALSAPIFLAEEYSILKTVCSTSITAAIGAVVEVRSTIIKTNFKSEIYRRQAATAVPVNVPIKSLYSFSWDLLNAVYVTGKEIAKTAAAGGLKLTPSVPAGETKAAGYTNAAATADNTPAFPLQGEGRSVSLGTGGVRPGERARVISKTRATAKSHLIPIAAASGAVAGAEQIKSATAAALDSAWWPPEWQPDGGLWIRQSHAVTIAEDGGLEVT